MIKNKDSYLTFNVRLTSFNVSLSSKEVDKEYYMIYRHVDRRLSILDTKTGKVIHPQSRVSLANKNLLVNDFKVGNRIDLIVNQEQQRQVQILGYADQFTKSTLNKDRNQLYSVFFMIKPGSMEKNTFGQILSSLQQDFSIQRFKMFTLTEQNSLEYIVNQKMQSTQNNSRNLQYLTLGPCFGFQLKGSNLLLRLRKLMGHQNPLQAKKSEPSTLRAKYGSNIILNCCYGSTTQKGAKKQIDFIFSNKLKEQKPKLKNTSLCLLKPHIVFEKKVGLLLTSMIQNGIQINCMTFGNLKTQLIKKYLDLYKFIPEYEENIEHFKQRKCVCLEIKINNSENVVQDFKRICGPYDPSYARKINPKSLRAIFGVNRVLNAIHCTQLYEDSESQLKIIFQC